MYFNTLFSFLAQYHLQLGKSITSESVSIVPSENNSGNWNCKQWNCQQQQHELLHNNDALFIQQSFYRTGSVRDICWRLLSQSIAIDELFLCG